MKIKIKSLFAFVLTIALSTTLTVPVFSSAVDTQTFTFDENMGLISNPYKGYFVHVRATGKKLTCPEGILPYIGGGYDRYLWQEVEIEDGVYDWSTIDAELEYWSALGKQFAFGIQPMSAEVGIPPWVSAMIETRRLESTDGLGRKTITIPADYKDELYLEQLMEFYQALADRYNGDRRIAFIDLRAYGLYGEGSINAGHYKNVPPELHPLEKWEYYYKPIADMFDETHLCGMMNDFLDYTYLYREAGVGIRRDTFLHSGYGEGKVLYNASQGEVFSVTEGSSYYNMNYNPNYHKWEIDWVAKDVEEAKICIYSSNYSKQGMNFDDAKLFIEGDNALARYLTRKLGYHFVLQNITLPGSVQSGTEFDVEFGIKNEGMTKIFDKCSVATALLDSNDNVVSLCWQDGLDTSQWLTEQSYVLKDKMKFDVDSGNYKLAIGFFFDKNDENPTYAIGNYGATDNKWYVIGDAVAENGTINFYETVQDKSKKEVTINGKFVTFMLNFVKDHNGEVLIPLRVTSEHVGAEVYWDEITGNISLIYAGQDTVFASDGTVISNGVKTNENSGLTMVKNTAYVKASVLAKKLLMNWDKENYDLIPVESGISNISDSFDEITNSGFEINDNSWYGDASFEYSDEASASGEKSLKLNNTSRAKAVQQIVSVDRDTPYRIDFKVKGDGYYMVRVTGDDDVIAGAATGTATGAWSNGSLYFKRDSHIVSGDKANVKIAFLETSDKGTPLYFDDITITEVDEIIEEEQTLDENVAISYDFESDIGDFVQVQLGAPAFCDTDSHTGLGCMAFNNRYTAWEGVRLSIEDAIMEKGAGTYRVSFWCKQEDPFAEPQWRSYGVIVNRDLPIKRSLISNGFYTTPEWTHHSFEVEINWTEADLNVPDFRIDFTLTNTTKTCDFRTLVDDFKIEKIK